MLLGKRGILHINNNNDCIDDTVCLAIPDLQSDTKGCLSHVTYNIMIQAVFCDIIFIVITLVILHTCPSFPSFLFLFGFWCEFDQRSRFYCFHILLELPKTELPFRSLQCLCTHLLSSADCNPSEPVCVVRFPGWKMPDCMFMCVCACVRGRCSRRMPFDTERLLEMQFSPFLYMRVFM